MINFTKAKFIKSAPSYIERPEKNLPEIVFVGKSNVGKSSIINALVKNKHMAFTSSKPGYTKLLNYFEIDEKFYLVDAPGYGYTASGGKYLDSFANMMEVYFKNCPTLAGVVFIVDSRHKMSHDDEDFYDFIVEMGIPFVIVASKIDKLNQSEKAQMKKNIAEAFGNYSEFVGTSIQDERTIEKLRQTLANLIKQ